MGKAKPKAVKREAFRIPRAFTIMSQRITVEYRPDLIYGDDSRGCMQARFNRIILQSKSPETPIPPEQFGQTFCHELVHFLLYYAERDKLFKDEALVNLLGGLLHQALTTAEYD